MDLCAVSRWCEGYRNKGKAQSSSALDRISEWITPTFQTLSRPEIIRGSSIENEKFPYISITYGGESVSQSPLKDNAFSTFLDQNPPFELPPKWNSALDKSLFHPMARHRQHRDQATSERQIAGAPLSSAVSQGNVARSKEARCGVVVGGLQHPILAICVVPGLGRGRLPSEGSCQPSLCRKGV